MSKYASWLLVKEAAELCEVNESRIRQILLYGWGGGKMFRTAKERGRIVIHPGDVEQYRRERKIGNPDIARHASDGGKKGGPARARKLSAQSAPRDFCAWRKRENGMREPVIAKQNEK